MSDSVLLFARAPELGRVKTRLAAGVGERAALEAYRWLGRRAVEALTPPGRSWSLRVLFTPDDAEDAVRAWLGEVDSLSPQGDGDLGERLSRAARRRFDAGDAKVLLVGTDCPALDAARVRAALDALDRSDAVLGPARDGGYWLLGLRRWLPVFEGVTWGTGAVADETRAALRAAGARWEELPTEADVDTVEDLDALPEALTRRLARIRGGR